MFEVRNDLHRVVMPSLLRKLLLSPSLPKHAAQQSETEEKKTRDVFSHPFLRVASEKNSRRRSRRRAQVRGLRLPVQEHGFSPVTGLLCRPNHDGIKPVCG